MTKRIAQASADYLKYAPVPRFAEIDYAFGSNLEEFKKLGGYGVVFIPSINRDINEYPIKRVYFKSEGKIIELKKLGEIKVKVTDAQTITTFGDNRFDYYYLLPYSFTQQKGELLIDWSKNREGFVLAKFPDGNSLSFDKDITSKDTQQINLNSFKEFLKREYNLAAD